MARRVWWPLVLAATLYAVPAAAQVINAARLAVLQAELRRAATPADLATLRNAARGSDTHTARLAVRALGRLERPSLVPALLQALDHRSPAVRSEAANAVAQALVGAPREVRAGIDVVEKLAGHLDEEADPEVRASLAQSIGRLSYRDEDAALSAQEALVAFAEPADTNFGDRLAAAKALEGYARLQRDYPLQGEALDLLRRLARGTGAHTDHAAQPDVAAEGRAAAEARRGARIRRLALEALITSAALDEETLGRVVHDIDPQVRRVAMRGAKTPALVGYLMGGLSDAAAIVRLEAVRGLPDAAGADACPALTAATSDPYPHVVLLALDLMRTCGQSDEAVGQLVLMASDAPAMRSGSRWHRPAHALLALAEASPDRARPLVERYRRADSALVRTYMARAAARLGDRALLEELGADRDDNVVEAAVEGLARVAGAAAADVYVRALGRQGYHVIRAAARALKDAEPRESVLAALESASERLAAIRQANSLDARKALAETLSALGVSPPPPRAPARASHAKGTNGATPPAPKDLAGEWPVASDQTSPLTLDDLRRLASPRARVTLRGLGTFDLALITQEAPATVLHFVRLAESGYYNGLTFHRVEPNFVVQGGSPAANEYVGHPDHMRDEVGLWPHVRGAVGISTRGRDTGDAQIFIDLVDNPRLDHQYTVFGYVVSGMEVVDRILEGDVIEKIELLAP